MNELELEGLDARIRRIVKEELDERAFGDAEEYQEEPDDTEEDIDELPSGSEVSKDTMKKLQNTITPEQRSKGGQTTKKKHEELNARDQEDELEDDDEDSEDDDESEYEA